MNEISHIASAVQADVDDVARIVGLDQRIGPAFLKAGLGWGGSCFPKDILALSAVAAGHGCDTPILGAVYAINDLQCDYATREIIKAVPPGGEGVVAILGLAFKPDTDDVRGSRAIAVAERLLEAGVQVRAHDPVATENAAVVAPHVIYAPDPYSALEGADAVLLATEWREYLGLDWALVREIMRGTTVFDGRGVLPGPALAHLGFRYLSFGHSPMHGHGEIAIDGTTRGVSQWME
jgi:UDPglucose 6-dehydrogenase